MNIRRVLTYATLALLCSVATDATDHDYRSVSTPPYLGGMWINPYGAHTVVEPSNPEYRRPEFQPPHYTRKYAAKHVAILRVWENGQAGKTDTDSIIFRRQLYCLPYGMPDMMLSDTSLDIQQTPDRITMVGEIDREIRHIWLDRKQLPLDDVDLGYFGRSVGHWEGRILVVNTIGVKEAVYGPDLLAHSDRMVISERLYLHSPDILYDDITVTDPLALTKPEWYRAIWIRAKKDFEPTEYVCDNIREVVGPDGKVAMKLGNK